MTRSLMLSLLLLPCLASAQVPAKLGYQGRLLKADGTPETGSQQFTFKIFAADSGGTELWTDTQTLALTDGYYATVLGPGTPSLDTVLDGRELFLELTIGSSTALAPRQRISSVPYAMVAGGVKGGVVQASEIKIGNTTVIDTSGKLAGTASYTINTGSGLTLNSTTNALSLPTCTANQILKYNGGWACADASANLTAAPGSGVTIGGTATAPTVALTPHMLEQGSNLIPNGFFRGGMDFWTVDNGAGAVVSNLTDSPGNAVFRNTATQVAWVTSDVRIPIDPSATYEVRGSFRRANANGNAGNIYLAVRAFDAAGANIGGDGTWWYYPLSSAALTDTVWHSYSFNFGPGGRAFPAAARFFTVGAILNYDGSVAGNRQYDVTGLGIYQVPLYKGLKLWAGFSGFANGTCGDTVAAPCNIDISGGSFSAAPNCTLSTHTPDATNYTEQMVIKNITATNLAVWRGNNLRNGTTMQISWICVGP